MKVGYARVSRPGQNLETQITLLQEAGCEKIFTDVASGVREDREGLLQMLSYVRKGDLIVIYKNDRIFRSLKNMVDLIEKLGEMEVHFKSLTEPQFDTTSANGKFLLQIFASVAEFERNLISERTKAGLVNARKRKKHLGRPKGPKKETLEKYNYANHLYKSMNVPIIEACNKAGLSKATFYRIDKVIGLNQSLERV